MAATCKFYKYLRYVSYDSGTTWLATGEYDRGELYEANSSDCGYVPPTPEKYLTFIAREDGTFSFNPTSTNTIQYSLDSGVTWTQLASGASTPTIESGQTVMWKGTMTPVSGSGIGTFSATNDFDAEGNAMSLLYGDNFSGQTDLSGKNYAFAYLFNNNSKVINAENLELPATTLADYCYTNMFANCTNLRHTPQIIANTTSVGCCSAMFLGCTSLISSSTLHPSTLANRCYYAMFIGCTSLQDVGIIDAIDFGAYSCACMFSGCTSIVTLRQTSLGKDYSTLGEYACLEMFAGCTSLTTAPQLPATTLATSCYNSMFRGCTSLNSITCLATDITANNCTSMWVYGVAQTGTFTKAASMNDWTSGISGIPSGWTVTN